MITSLDNRTVKELRKLHQKKYREDRFLLLDEDMILLAKQKGLLRKLICCGEAPFEHDDVLEVSQEVLNKIADREGLHHVGVSGMIEDVQAKSDRIIMLDHLQDPLNIGRIMEAARLFGFGSVVLSEGCADIYNEKCLANCKGGIYTLELSQRDLFEETKRLQDMGYKVYATGLSNDTKEMHEVAASEKMAFILGNEGSGVRLELMDICDEVMKIDMRNIDSLNVGMAASIIMYQFRI
jgi:TrmH family RNA methyltransferase